MSFRTSPVPSYLHIDNGTSPTSSKLTIQQSPKPSLPCSSILHLSGLLDPSSQAKADNMSVPEEAPNAPQTPLPHHTCSLCSLIRRHDQRSLPSSGSQASRLKGTVEKENFSSGASLCLIEEEGLCNCKIQSVGSEDDVTPPPSPSSPLTVKAKPGIAPYFPPSPLEEAKEESSPGLHAAPCQVNMHPSNSLSSHFNTSNDQQTSTVVDTSDPVENQHLTIKRTLDTLLQKRRSPSAMVRASHAALSFPERLI